MRNADEDDLSARSILPDEDVAHRACCTFGVREMAVVVVRGGHLVMELGWALHLAESPSVILSVCDNGRRGQVRTGRVVGRQRRVLITFGTRAIAGMSVLLLGEWLTPAQWIGIALVVMGVVTVALSS